MHFWWQNSCLSQILSRNCSIYHGSKIRWKYTAENLAFSQVASTGNQLLFYRSSRLSGKQDHRL